MKSIAVKSQDPNVIKEAKTHGVEIVEEPKPLLDISTKEDEERAVGLSAKSERLFLWCSDWKVIPLENLIAKNKGARLYAVVDSHEEAKLALTTMELGTDGILLRSDDPAELRRTINVVQKLSTTSVTDIEEAKITRISALDSGARACIDTCVLMEEGEGMLVGSGSNGMILVQAEVVENELADPRPFRVNAGVPSLYSLSPDDKTKYLQELSAGDSVLLVKRNGTSRSVNVARSKIEIRPLILIEAEKDGKKAIAILQNAETIRLVTGDSSIPVTNAKIGDRILVHFQDGARHFGSRLDGEIIIER